MNLPIECAEKVNLDYLKGYNDGNADQHAIKYCILYLYLSPSLLTRTCSSFHSHSYMPSAPSPQFPGLAASPLQHNTEEGFSFMHESEVDRSMYYLSSFFNMCFTDLL